MAAGTAGRLSAVATLVQRTSRYAPIVALPDGIDAGQVAQHLTRSLLEIPPQLLEPQAEPCGLLVGDPPVEVRQDHPQPARIGRKLGQPF